MEWHLVQPADLPSLVRRVEDWPIVIFDTETTGVNLWAGDTMLGIGLGSYEADSPLYYLPTRGLNDLDIRPLMAVLEEKPLGGHNIKFDLHALGQLGFRPKQRAFRDVITLARLWLTEDHPKLGLKDLGWRLLRYEYKRQDVIKKINQLEKLDDRDTGEYCCEDVHVTREVLRWLLAHVPDHLKQLWQRECLLTRDLWEMEDRGLELDGDYVLGAVKKMDERLEGLLADIQAESGRPEFNPQSSPQLRELMASLKVRPVKMAKTGPSWDRESLQKVQGAHPIARKIAIHKGLSYLRNGTFEEARVQVEDMGTLDFHGDYHNWGTVTGRLSSNRQQMPKGWLQIEAGEGILEWEAKRPVEKEYSTRRMIKPREGYILIMVDYKQIEMFVLGHYMKDRTFTRWLNSDDVHAAVAEEVWEVSRDQEDFDDWRKAGKEYNFSLVYGQGIAATAVKLGISYEEAEARRYQYFDHMPGYNKLKRKVAKKLRDDGFLLNPYGRWYWLEPDVAYKGINYLVQGSAGDYVKFRLPATRAMWRELGIHVLNTTHDDFLLEVPMESLGGLEDMFTILRQSPFGCELGIDVEWSEQSYAELQPWEGVEAWRESRKPEMATAF